MVAIKEEWIVIYIEDRTIRSQAGTMDMCRDTRIAQNQHSC